MDVYARPEAEQPDPVSPQPTETEEVTANV
jgi:hypothetical protein